MRGNIEEYIFFREHVFEPFGHALECHPTRHCSELRLGHQGSYLLLPMIQELC